MKAEKKRVGTKAQIRAIKEKERRIVTAVFLALILFIAVISVYFTYTFLNQPQNPSPNPTSSQLKAAIVDHLSLTFPNQTFIKTATTALKQAGYSVDYFAGEKVTVELYRNLSACGYKIIILRVHSAIAQDGGPPVCFFTSEPYDQSKYVWDQFYERLGKVHYIIADEDQLYFGILPPFLRECMKGKFQNATIIAMGCNGLSHSDMATAFIEKGAKVYISWNAAVSATHTDTATIELLRHLVTEGQTIQQAVNNTMEEVGADPTSGSLLAYYPLEAGEQTIENFNGKNSNSP